MPADNVTPAKRKAPEVDALAHHSALVNGLSRFFELEELADVDFVLDDGTTFPGHTVVLASQEYFRMLLLDSGLKEAQPGATAGHPSCRRQVVLKDVDREPFKAVMQYIYQGPQSVRFGSPAQAMQILDLADRYGIQALCEKVVKSLTVLLGGMEPEEKIRSCLGLLVAVQGRATPGVWEEVYITVVKEAQMLMPQLVQASRDESGQDLLYELTPETLNDMLCGDALAAPGELLVELVEHVVLPWCRRRYKKPAMDVPGLLQWCLKWRLRNIPLVASLELKVPKRGKKVSSAAFSLPLHRSGLRMRLELSALKTEGCSSDIPFALRTVVDKAVEEARSSQAPSSSSDVRSLSPGVLAAINYAYTVKHRTDRSRHRAFRNTTTFYSSQLPSTSMLLSAEDNELTDVNQGFMSDTGSLAIDVSMSFTALSAVVFGYVAAKFYAPGLAKATLQVVTGRALLALLSCKGLNVPDELSVLTAFLESGQLSNKTYRENLLKAIRWPFLPPSSALELARHHPVLKESEIFRFYTSKLLAEVAKGDGDEVMFHTGITASGPRDSYSSTATRERWPSSLMDLLSAPNKGIEAIEAKAAEDRRQLEQRIHELEQALEQKKALEQRIQELEARVVVPRTPPGPRLRVTLDPKQLENN